MLRSTLTSCHRPATRPAARLIGLARRVFSLIPLARQRRALKHLDGYRLDDMGISPAAARAETARPFWDAPSHWQM